MGYGEVWWFLRDEGVESLDEAVTALRAAGLVAGNPATGVPQILDTDGQQIKWIESEVQKRWAAGETVTAQLWVNPETDVLVELMRPSQLFTFDLDGMTTAEARITVFAVINAALSLPGTQAVIVDRHLPDRGDEVLEAMAAGSVGAGIHFAPDLMVSVTATGHYTIDVRTSSWLAQPAAGVRSFG